MEPRLVYHPVITAIAQRIGKTPAQVVTLLGRPDQSFNDGTEIGYTDKAFDPAANRKGMLIIGFEDGAVTTLRVGYTGRKMTP